MHQWQSLNLTSWTLLVSLEVRQCKLCYCTRVKLRFLPVYIESLTMSSQEPLLGKQVSKKVLYFVKVNTNGKLDKNKRYCRQMWWSDMYQEVCFNRGTEAPGGGGGELIQATRSALPVILCLLRAWDLITNAVYHVMIFFYLCLIWWPTGDMLQIKKLLQIKSSSCK